MAAMDDGVQMNGGRMVHHHLNNNNIKGEHTNPQEPSNVCSSCTKPIVDQYLLKALDCYWHEDCLRCGCCGCRLGEVGSTLYTRANLILCKRDYLRLFGTSGNCAACSKVIPAFEMVMRAKDNVYHLDCFACQQCHQRFCVGDRFYLCDNKILCEYDYEERFILTNLQAAADVEASPSPVSTSDAPPPLHISRRVTDYQQSANAGDDPVGLLHQPLQQQLMNSFDQPLVEMVRGFQQPFIAGNRLQQLLKHGSPSDGSSSGYGSPESIQLE